MCGLRLVPQLKWTALSRAERHSKWVHIGLHDVCLLHAARCVGCHSTIQHDREEEIFMNDWSLDTELHCRSALWFVITGSYGLSLLDSIWRCSPSAMKMFTLDYTDYNRKIPFHSKIGNSESECCSTDWSRSSGIRLGHKTQITGQIRLDGGLIDF